MSVTAVSVEIKVDASQFSAEVRRAIEQQLADAAVTAVNRELKRQLAAQRNENV